MFVIDKLKNIEFSLDKKTIIPLTRFKRDRVALVGLPPTALGPKDILHRRKAGLELAGALFRYLNSLENMQTFPNSSGVYIFQCMPSIK